MLTEAIKAHYFSFFNNIQYLQNHEENKYEIIVVNDGSKDRTIETALSFSKFEDKKINLKVIDYEFNKGKGGAVRIGMLTALGDQILMVDADGATQFSDLKKLQQNMKEIDKNGLGIIAGSRREIMEAEAKINRSLFRSILGSAFHLIVSKICRVQLQDTQCGFKLFTQKTARIIFRIQHIERWAFDVELFVIANYHKIPVKEVPVNWEEIDGSKLNVVEASFQMGRDQILISLLYMMKLWKLEDYYIMPSK